MANQIIVNSNLIHKTRRWFWAYT